MVINRRFNFAAVDIFATTNHHVFCAVHNVDKPVFINTCNVSSVQPAISNAVGGGLSTIEVTLNDDRTTYAQNANRVGVAWQIIAIFVNQFAFKRWH